MSTRLDLTIDQGADFQANVVTTLDLTGYTANATFKTNFSSVTSNSLDVTLSGNTVTLSMNAESSANVSAQRYVWDLVLTSGGGAVTREREGVLTVTPQVSVAP